MPSRRAHPSDSHEQRAAEAIVLAQLSEHLGFSVRNGVIRFDDGRQVNVDGVNHEHRYLCEVFCRIGVLQAAQVEKVASDILKLTLVERMLGGQWRKECCFVDERAAGLLSGRSWVAAAAQAVGVEPVVMKLPSEHHQAVLMAQRRQVMTNPLATGAVTPVRPDNE